MSNDNSRRRSTVTRTTASRAYDTHVPTHREPSRSPTRACPPHTWRPTDVDPKAEKRAERQVAAMFIAVDGLHRAVRRRLLHLRGRRQLGHRSPASAPRTSPSASPSACALLFIGIGIIQWARKLMADHEIVEMRHPAALLRRGPRRRPLAGPQRRARRSPASAAARWCATPARRRRPARPARRSCCCATSAPGDALDGDKLGAARIWEPGMRVVRDVVGTPIRASEIEIGDLVNAAPEAMFPTRGERLPRARGRRAPGREGQGRRSSSSGWSPTTSPRSRAARTGPSTGSSATPRSAPTWAARSPSTSAPRTTCCARATSRPSTSPTARKVIFGPAARPLPQLPIAVDDEGYLVAQSDFNEPVGPSFWEREKLMSVDTSKVATSNRTTRRHRVEAQPGRRRWPRGPTTASAWPRR